MYLLVGGFFFFKQKTAYEVRISDWSSDVCSSDLAGLVVAVAVACPGLHALDEIGGLRRDVQRIPAQAVGRDRPVAIVAGPVAGAVERLERLLQGGRPDAV